MAAPHSKLTAAIPAKIRFIKIPQKNFRGSEQTIAPAKTVLEQAERR